MLLFPALILGLSLGLLAYWVFSLNLPGTEEVGARRRDLSGLHKWTLAYAHRMGQWALNLLKASSPQWSEGVEKRADRLALHADRPWSVTGVEVVGFSLLLPLAVLPLTGLYLNVVCPDLFLIGMVLALVFCLILPTVLLLRTRNERWRKMWNALPLALDLLTLCIEAGMDFTEGMKLLANRCVGIPLKTAQKRPDYSICKLFAEVLQDIQMGIPRNQALRRLEAKTGLTEVGTLATVLSLADETGGDVAENLRRLSGEMRNSRVMRAEEHIAKAPIKVAFAAILFLFPMVFVVIVGPLGVSLMESMKF